MNGLKAVLVLALVSPYIATAAEWKRIFEHDEHSTYVDASRTKKIGNKTQVWELWSNSSAGNSLMMRKEYDCIKETVKTTYGEFFAQPMAGGSGQELDVSKEKARPVAPATRPELVMRYVCK